MGKRYCSGCNLMQDYDGWKNGVCAECQPECEQCAGLREEIQLLEQRRTSLDDEVERRRRRAIEEIERHGGRWCNIPACNCDGVHWSCYYENTRAESAEAKVEWLLDKLVEAELGCALHSDEKIRRQLVAEMENALRTLRDTEKNDD